MLNRNDTLGLRLDAEMSRRMSLHMRRTRRSKSAIARDALDRYLDREVSQAEIDRQLALIAAAHDADPAHWDDVFALRDEMLGGVEAVDVRT